MTDTLHRVAGATLLAGLALTIGALMAEAQPAAYVAIAAILLVAFLTTARDAIPMMLLVGSAVVAVLYVQATQGSVPSTAKYSADALFLLGIPFLVRLGRSLTPVQRRAVNQVVLWTAASAFAGVLGPGSSLRLVILSNWQDMRWVGAVGIGVAVAGMLAPSQRRRWAFLWLLGLNALNMAVSAYQVLTHAYTATRLGLPELTGLFGQTTSDSLAATLLLIFVLVEHRAHPRPMSRSEAGLAVGIGLVDLLLSTRFKPGLAIIAVLALVYLHQMGVRPLALAFLGAAVPITVTLALAWVTAPGRGQSESEAVTSLLAHATPRVQFMSGAQGLASTRFPLGEGSGTYGSDLSLSTEQRAFSDAGLAGTYGFRTQGPKFNSDNFVAHVLGERGYAGLAAWLISLVALIYFALVASPFMFPASVAIAVAALAPVVPVFRDSSASLLLFVPAALYLRSQQDAERARSSGSRADSSRAASPVVTRP